MTEDYKRDHFTLNIEPECHFLKPRNVGHVRNTVCSPDAVKSVTGEQLCKYIAEGRTFTAGVLFGKTADKWQDQRLLVVDIDNEEPDPETGKMIPCKDPLRINGILNILEAHSLHYAAIYETFSSTEDQPRYRVIFMLDRVIEDPEQAERMNRKTAAIFPGYDPKCCDLARLFFGTRGACRFYKRNSWQIWTRETVSVEQIEALPDPAEFKTQGWKRSHEGKNAAAKNTCEGRQNGKRPPVPGAEKGGVVGAWCKVFDCYRVMDILCANGIYMPTKDPNRFLYHGSSSGIAGLVICDNGQFAYSFSASDPAGNGGHRLNSFDLYRIAVFGTQ